MKKTKKMLSFVLSMLLIVTMFPTMAFAKEEAKTWKFGELSLKAGDVLGKDTEIKNDAENREIRILSEKTNPDEKKDQKDDKERIKTEKEAVIAAAASWNLKDLTEKAKKAPADYLLKKADSWNGSWIVTKIAETETKDAIEIQIRTYEYVAVTEIQGIPKEIPGTTALTGKAVPENADQKQITWEITDAGMTGAVLDGTNLKVTNAGTVNLLATIKDGKKTGVDFTQEFTVIVKAADYTKVTEALALIPEDMGRYTEESAAAVQKAKILVRVNPIHEALADYPSSQDEIESVIKAGADIIMLPFFKKVTEVQRFLSIVDGRAKTCLLVETPEAALLIDEILELKGIDMIHLGLNDLHLALGMKFMFELLADGTVDRLSSKIKAKGIPFGFGGIATLTGGAMPGSMVLKEHYRLGSSMVIVSRSFCNTDITTNLNEVRTIFNESIADIRRLEEEAQEAATYFSNNRSAVIDSVNQIVENK